jgi:putative GTP pyrophosphokinase
MKSNANGLIIDFEKKIKKYENFSSKMSILLKELLDQEEISYHSIVSRVKEKGSLSKKIEGKDKYQILDEITDIVGCRIITYFEDDVEKIVDIITKEFKIDKENSIDKKKILDPDRFGYLSYHIVCSINNDRGKLREYIPYKNIKFEIQIRTILQHAWAEIEHDIGYKSNIAVPRDFRRKFSRIAGMLEIADDEFSRLKHDIYSYVEDISAKGIEDTDINVESLKIFINKSEDIREIENFVITELSVKFNQYSEKEQDNQLNWMLDIINEFTEYKKIIDIKNFINLNKETIKQFIILWVTSREELLSRYQKNEIMKISLVVGYCIFVLFIDNNNQDGLERILGVNKSEENFKHDLLQAKKIYSKITEKRV